MDAGAQNAEGLEAGQQGTKTERCIVRCCEMFSGKRVVTLQPVLLSLCVATGGERRQKFALTPCVWHGRSSRY